MAMEESQLEALSGIDNFHLPSDANEFTKGLIDILNRIPNGWGRWIRCERGWYSIIVGLDRALAELNPDYEIWQIKEKFGTLHYYCTLSEDGALAKEMGRLVDKASSASGRTCELCGNPGELQGKTGWVKTLCPPCGSAVGYRPMLNE